MEMTARAEIVSIGDELLIGQTVNTNAAFIGEHLHEIGIPIERVLTVGDDAQRILDAFETAWNRCDIVITTGGLGPTHDDITRSVVIDFFKCDLKLDPVILDDVEKFFSSRQRSMSTVHRDQAMVPSTATAIRNPIGTAPGFLFERGEKCFIVLPGVPAEMKAMMTQTVIPFLSARYERMLLSRTLLTTGIYESQLAERVGDVHALPEGAALAFLPNKVGVKMRVTVSAQSPTEGDAKLSAVCKHLYDAAGDFIFAEGDRALEEVVQDLMIQAGKSISIAESCTGGLIGHLITNVSGSSKYFLRDVVAYSNETKQDVLMIQPEMIARLGAVSEEVAIAMAQNIRLSSGSSIGISTTGIAGPDGGTDMKPVGLTWIGYSDESESVAYRFTFGNHRVRTKERAAYTALEIVRRKLLGLPIYLY